MLSILVVEDDDGVREFLVRACAAMGCRAIGAATPEEAMRLADHRRFDMVIADVLLPNVTGCQLAEHLRAGQPGVPVLLISGYPEKYLRDHYGMNEQIPFLQKPFTVRTLMGRLEALDGVPALGHA